MTDDSDGKRGPGRPQKWADNAERMRAYRAKIAHERNVIKAGGTYVEMAEQIAEMTRQRDKNWAQVTRLQEQIKTLKRDRPARRATASGPSFGNPDDAAEAAFATATDTRRGASDHADCDAEIGRLASELAASERHNVDLKSVVRKLEGLNAEQAQRIMETMPRRSPGHGQPAMSRAQRREAERQAKRKQRRS